MKIHQGKRKEGRKEVKEEDMKGLSGSYSIMGSCKELFSLG